ncbi:unnamed protein product [Closterium sp. NIES-64]|nr:unnamed protein product [Closterium sp. Naga37s-1]CAI5935562.1 unnamed protein product [Closterium sp. NIES-64]
MDAEKLIPTSRVPDDRQKLLAGSSSHASHAMDVDDSVRLPEPARRTPSSAYKSGKEAFLAVLHSWATKRFMSGCAILFPIAITFYMTWWFFTFVDGFFSPIYRHVYGIDILGLGFITTISFIFFVGVFVSSWVGSSVLWIGEWIIHRMPLMKHIYSASKQISNAISPDQNVNAFKEVAILRHPRIGEYAFGFITSNVTLQLESGVQEELVSVYVPTNHVYIGDTFLVPESDIIRPNLSVREGLEIVVSGGMSMPKVIQPACRSPAMKGMIGFG